MITSQWSAFYLILISLINERASLFLYYPYEDNRKNAKIQIKGSSLSDSLGDIYLPLSWKQHTLRFQK